MFEDWQESLDLKTAARIHKRLLRVEEGNYGDHKRFEGLMNYASILAPVTEYIA
jgi:putative component of toxin-antitoxin plasmid stabilization module